jgi:hypothetical protein
MMTWWRHRSPARQNQEDAEAALHLAVLLVQWLTAGVLRRKP